METPEFVLRTSRLTLLMVALAGAVALLIGCAGQQRYGYEEFLRLEPFEAQIVRITRLSSMTYETALSGQDLVIELKKPGGSVVVVAKVPTSLEGQFCGTIDPWLVVEPRAGAYEARGGTFRFPDLIRPKPDCSKPTA